MSLGFYAVTASPPTAVSHCCVGSFTGPDDFNVVVAKSTRFVVYTWTGTDQQAQNNSGGDVDMDAAAAAASADNTIPLVETLDIPLYGHIVYLKLVRLSGNTDSLIVLTHRMQFFVLKCESTPDGSVRIDTVAQADLADAPGRPSDRKLVAIDPKKRCLALHTTDGLIKIIKFDERDGTFNKEVFNNRIEEIQVLDMCFLENRDAPTLAILHHDTQDLRHVKSYQFDLATQEMTTGNFEFPHVEDGASMLAPVQKGVLIFGESTVMLFDGEGFSSHVFEDLKIVRAAGKVDDTRWLFGDQHGKLYVLGILNSASHVAELQTQKLGETSAATCLAYISQGYVFVGSAFGDSQLIRLQDGSKQADDADLVEVITSYPNLGPITDLAVVGLQQQAHQSGQNHGGDADASADALEAIGDDDQSLYEGQGQIVTCSGAFKDGTLRVVRSGIGVEAALEVAIGGGIKNIWALKHPAKLSANGDPSTSHHDDFLVCAESGAGITILGVLMEDDSDGSAAGQASLGPTEIPGFDEESRTLSCASAGIGGVGVLIQVTPTEVIVCASAGAEIARVAGWRPEDGRIQAAFANSAGQVMVACGEVLHYLRVVFAAGSLQVKMLGSRKFDHEVACVDATALAQEDVSCPEATVCAVGLWTDRSLRLVSLDSSTIQNGTLHQLSSLDLQEDLHARSVLLQSFYAGARMRQIDTVFVGLGDGHVLAFEIEDSVFDGRAAKKLTNRRKVSLGTHPITLVSFLRAVPGASADEPDMMSRYVFVCGDRPTVIHADANGRLLFSNVNTRGVQSVSGFNTQEFGNCVAISQEDDAEDEPMEGDEGVGSLITVGTVDGIQKLHKETVCKFGEGPRRITYDPSSNLYAAVTVKIETIESDQIGDPSDIEYVDETSVSHIYVLDGSTFERLSVMRLRDQEIASSTALITLSLPSLDGKTSRKKSLFAIGTADEKEDEAEPSQGRILFFDPSRCAANRQAGAIAALEALCSVDANGAVYSIAQLSCRPNTFVVAVNSRVRVYEIVFSGDSIDFISVRQLCEHYGALVCLSVKTHGEFVVVGDLMRSVSLLRFSTQEDSEEMPFYLEEIGRDFYPNWMTAVAVVDADTFLGAENNCNLFVVHRNPGVNDEERGRLDTVGRFHLGEFVNVFRRGSLVMPPPAAPIPAQDDSSKLDERTLTEWATAPIIPKSTIVWGAVSGAIGLVCSLTPEGFAFLQKVEAAMRGVVQGYGEQRHDEWRSFNSDRLKAPVVGFVDGDLVEKYLMLSPSEQVAVATDLDVDAEALARRIDILQRALH